MSSIRINGVESVGSSVVASNTVETADIQDVAVTTAKIADSNVTTAKVADAAITLAKMANLAQDQFIGRTTASTGVPQTATITSAARSALAQSSNSAILSQLGVTTVATDTIFDAAGDLAIGSGADAATKLAVSAVAGRALVTDPAAALKSAWGNPLGAAEANMGVTGTLASTFNRTLVNNAGLGGPTSGRLTLMGICLPKGMTVTSITFWAGTTALSAGSNQWFSLYDVSGNKLAVTNDDTSTAWSASAAKTLALNPAFVTTYTGFYYLGFVVVASTVPTLSGLPILTTGPRAGTPMCSATSTTGLTNPASAPNPFGALTISGLLAYAEVS